MAVKKVTVVIDVVHHNIYTRNDFALRNVIDALKIPKANLHRNFVMSYHRLSITLN